MRVLIQRVLRASVKVGDETTGSIGRGLLVFLGVGESDTESVTDELAAKVCRMRIFEDAAGKMNLNVDETGGEVLVVSQFTLYADTKKGNRPSFIAAARPEVAEPLYQRFLASIRTVLGPSRVAEGRFAAMMEVELINDGPVTIWVDSSL